MIVDIKEMLAEDRATYYQHINTCPTCKAAPYDMEQRGFTPRPPQKDRKKLCHEGAKLLHEYQMTLDAHEAAVVDARSFSH